MKKRNLVIASLLILSLSFVFFGCGPVEEEEPTPTVDPHQDALDLIAAMGYTDTVKEPVGGTFDDYFVDNETTPSKVAIAWKGCDATKYTAYKTAWGLSSSINDARFVYSSNAKAITSKLPDGFGGAIDFFETAPTNDQTADGNLNLDVVAGSIVLIIYKSE